MSSGATPRGARTEEEAARWVRAMFGRVAGRYDLLNHLLSANIDRHWRTKTVRRVNEIPGRPDAICLDLCCGTGDLMIALQKAGPSRVLGSDFCHPMLLAARAKRTTAELFEADALRLPLRDHSLDLITVAFGFRNLANYQRGIEEMLRVLKPSGTAAILEFSQPRNRALKAAYNFYSRGILPAIGGLVSGSADAYTYLPESVRKFPAADELAEQIRTAGFRDVRYELMTGGIVALHLATA